jgi:DNA primase
MNSQPLDAKLSFIKRAFGQYQLSSDGKNIAVSCPKCKATHKKKLAIQTQTDVCNCWVCGLSGRLVSVLIKYKHSFVHEYISSFVGKNITLLNDVEERKDIELPSGFQLLAPLINSSEKNISQAVDYILSRGLTERDMWYFKFGIATEQALQKRVIMPSFDAEGKLNFYTGRALDASAFRKYMNCDVEKKSIIFNELNIDWSRELTLVEGPFDLTKCDDNATCLLGSSLSEDSALFSQIYKHMTPVVLALDSDMVAKSWQRIARMLSSYDIPVKIIELGSFKDVVEMTKKQFLQAKASAKTWDRTDALLMKMRSIQI